MPQSAPRTARRRARAQERRAAHRARRFAALAVLATVAVVTLLVTAFRPSAGPAATPAEPASPARLLPAGPPAPAILARQGSVRIQLPIEQSRVTAIGYHASDDGALALDPLGRRGNEGVLARVARSVFGGASGSLVWYQLPGGDGPATATLNVGAAPDTDVYSPVDGTIVAITDYILNRQKHGVRIDIRPTSAPAVIVSVMRLRPDPSLTVGTGVAAGSNRLGTLLDFSRVEAQALARYTQDAGNHMALQVRPSAALTLP
jgi:hypothetical protein